jgi:hypothetical protein
MARCSPPRKVMYFEPIAPRLARNTIIESTFEVAAAFRCTMRVDCGELDPGVVAFLSQKKTIFAIVPQRVSDTAKGENAGLGSERRWTYRSFIKTLR